MTLDLWNLVLVHLEIVLVSFQDRCMVCAKRTMGLDIVFNTSMVLLGDEAQVEAHFWSFGDRANHDAPDDTPRLRGSCRILFWSIWR